MSITEGGPVIFLTQGRLRSQHVKVYMSRFPKEGRPRGSPKTVTLDRKEPFFLGNWIKVHPGLPNFSVGIYLTNLRTPTLIVNFSLGS